MNFIVLYQTIKPIPYENTFLCFLVLFVFIICGSDEKHPKNTETRFTPDLKPDRYNAAFLIMNGLHNRGFTASYDIFQHTHYRENIKAINTFTVANTLAPVTSFERVRFLPDFDYTKDSLPNIDILVVPSAEHYLDTDLKDSLLLNFIKK
ncbi:type 1 glutamine amidotransferase family protein [Maribacter antarcticus]|uniref:hypothetical protein n=1 Tax=Maribacter antarcticus TaxID=505250 RepID=UPI0029347327|nr:hypothetical protein [Maribacter antarcticus]